MAYAAAVIPVMIASPGDVAEERSIAREVLHEWNDINAANSRVVLSPVGWETHASPELGTRPQELINKRILRDCDLLVGVFWTRLGTPTGNAKSGTVEEIQEHIRAGKPAMIYFSSRPVAPQSIDAQQFSEVQAFKAECKALGLIEEYDTAEEFRLKFSRQLQVCLIHNPYIRSLVAQDTKEPTIDVNVPGASEDRLNLSADAITLLKAAARGKSGIIMNARYIGGHDIQAGDEKFGGQYGRESARWEAALEELVNKGLVVDRGYKGEIFELTHLGWSLADKL
jgi:hypothetical protein